MPLKEPENLPLSIMMIFGYLYSEQTFTGSGCQSVAETIADSGSQEKVSGILLSKNGWFVRRDRRWYW